jgi:hypothetical protein
MEEVQAQDANGMLIAIATTKLSSAPELIYLHRQSSQASFIASDGSKSKRTNKMRVGDSSALKRDNPALHTKLQALFGEAGRRSELLHVKTEV